jgi:hypothetical protein
MAEIPAAELEQPSADVYVPDEGPIYDPASDRERIRGVLAMGALLLLVATIAALLLPVIVGFRTWNQMQGPTAAFLPAVLGVTGSVLTFYFATDEKRKK